MKSGWPPFIVSAAKGTREGYCCPAIRCNIDPPRPCCLLRLQRAPFLLRCDCAVTWGTKSGSQLGLNMELHAHLHLIKLSGICQAANHSNEGWRSLINALVTREDACRGHRLSLIWAGCQGADCQRAGKSGTIRRWVIYGV